MAEISAKDLFRRHIALTNEHGSWVFLLSPLIIGLVIGGRLTIASLYLVLAVLAVFLVRHPIIIVVKVFSGRRSARDLPAAYFWIAVYAVAGLAMVTGLIAQGFSYLLVLGIPGALIFGWHLSLVRRRSERRQQGVEVVASGALALAAPAAYWVGRGSPEALGWWLWALTWFQSAASIVYAYLRLEQRTLSERPDMPERLRKGRRALAYASFNLGAVLALAGTGVLPPWIFLAYALQWAETLWGTLNPAIGVRPTLIGFRQLLVSTLFTLVFLLAWFLGA